MGNYKYVMFEVTRKGVTREVPIIFPEELVHSDVADVVPHAIRVSEVDAGMREWSTVKPIRAGFIRSLVVDVTYGESESLDLKSDPKDAGAINTHPWSKGTK